MRTISRGLKTASQASGVAGCPCKARTSLKTASQASAVVAVLATLVAAGCGTHGRSPSAAGAPGSLKSLLQRPGEDVSVVAGDSDFAPGVVRFSFLVIRHDARPSSVQ